MDIAGFIRAHRALLRADLVIMSDGPATENGRPTIEFGVRGVVSFEMQARGAERDLHSGNYGGIAPHPLWTLVHLLSTMNLATWICIAARACLWPKSFRAIESHRSSPGPVAGI